MPEVVGYLWWVQSTGLPEPWPESVTPIPHPNTQGCNREDAQVLIHMHVLSSAAYNIFLKKGNNRNIYVFKQNTAYTKGTILYSH